MQITDSLNLVIPFGEGMVAYHTPVSRQVYEANYAALNAAHAALVSRGVQYNLGSGPLIASLVLRDEGARDATERGTVDEKTPAFLAEIRRLTNVLAPGAAGYDLLPVDAAISRWRGLAGTGGGHRFFYLPHGNEEEEGQAAHGELRFPCAGWIDYLIAAYGVRRFLADLDEGRTFRGNTLIDTCLRFVAREGFPDYAQRHGLTLRCAREYRERYLIEALRGSTGF